MPALHQAVDALIDSDLEHIAQLTKLLRSEREALQARDSEALQQVIKAKAAHLSALQANAVVRHQLLRLQGLDNSTNGWLALLNQQPQPYRDSLHKKWSVLREQLNECSDLVETNGRIVAKTQRTIGKLLEILRGQGTAGAIKMYNSSGRTENFGDNRPITSA